MSDKIIYMESNNKSKIFIKIISINISISHFISIYHFFLPSPTEIFLKTKRFWTFTSYEYIKVKAEQILVDQNRREEMGKTRRSRKENEIYFYKFLLNFSLFFVPKNYVTFNNSKST